MIPAWVHLRIKEKYTGVNNVKTFDPDIINESNATTQNLTVVSPSNEVQNVTVSVIGETAYVKNLAASKQLNG